MVMSSLLSFVQRGLLSFCSSSLFIIRYEGHVDLVTAHKAHFEIVEREGLVLRLVLLPLFVSFSTPVLYTG